MLCWSSLRHWPMKEPHAGIPLLKELILTHQRVAGLCCHLTEELQLTHEKAACQYPHKYFEAAIDPQRGAAWQYSHIIEELPMTYERAPWQHFEMTLIYEGVTCIFLRSCHWPVEEPHDKTPHCEEQPRYSHLQYKIQQMHKHICSILYRALTTWTLLCHPPVGNTWNHNRKEK